MSPACLPHPIPAARLGRPARLAVGAALAVTCAAGLVPGAARADTRPVVLQSSPPAAVRVAAGHGHVVAMESRPGGGSVLVELVAGQAPRELARFAGDVAWPTVGTDASKRPVAVVSPCLQAERATPLPACNLVVVGLTDGRTRTLPRSKGAYLGDLDGAHAVVARRSATTGVRVALTSGSAGTPSRPLPLGALLPAPADPGYPAAARFVDSLDLSGGMIAATFLWGMANGGDGGGSVLARRSTAPGARWTELAHSGYGGASGIRRVFRAATVSPTGVRAMYDGGDNEGSYVARWRIPGRFAREIGVAPSTVASAAFDRSRLVTVGAEGFGCGGEADPCAIVRTASPLKLG